MKIKTLLIAIITLVTCFLLSGCLILSVLADDDMSTTTTIATSEIVEQVDEIAEVTEEEFEPIDYSSLYTDSSKANSIYADQLFSLIVSDKDLRNPSSFDNLGYDITEEDALFYAKASALMGDTTNAYKMLTYLGYEIDNEDLTKIKNYLKGKNHIQKGDYTNAYQILNRLGYLDSKELSEEMIAQGLVVGYENGEVGPAGGYIFYDCDADNDSGNADGLISTECGWRYLEAAPTDLSYTNSSGTTTKYYPFGYYRTSSSGSNSIVGTKTAIGTGKANTEALVKAMGETAYTRYSGTSKGIYAAKACADYSITVDGVVYDDWFLPSKDELNLMYTNLHKKSLGSFDNSGYWSSSEEYTYDAWDAWSQDFGNGQSSDLSSRNRDFCVRPIRAF